MYNLPKAGRRGMMVHEFCKKEGNSVKYIFQFARITAFCLAGEVLAAVLPLTMRPPRLNLPPLPHLRNLPPPPRSRSPRSLKIPKNPRTLLKRPPLRLPTLTPPT